MAAALSIGITGDSAMRQIVVRYAVRWSAMSGYGPCPAADSLIRLRVQLIGSDSQRRCTEFQECDAGDEMLVELVELAQWCAPERCGWVAAKGQRLRVRFRLSENKETSSAAVEIEIACRPTDRTGVSRECDGACLRYVRERLTSIGAIEL
jgi:hypothetical protein